MRRFLHLGFCLTLVLTILHADAAQPPSSGASSASPARTSPNIVIVIGDDATFSDLPLHGGTNVKTPHLDTLASQGIAFNHAYLTSAMCQPCRAELYTGQFPARNGCTWNHSASRPGTKSAPHYFGDLGYRVALTGKTHIVPKESFPFQIVPGFEPGCVKDTADSDCAGIRAFMSSAKKEGAPFFLVVALVSPHAPWTVGDPAQFDQEKLKLPPNFIDTPSTRESYARYLAEIADMDRQLGDVMETVEATGNADGTIFIFTSEQGAQFPGCKWTCWDQGVHTAFVVRWPGTVAPGTRTDAMIHYADVVPTLLEAAGGSPPETKKNAFDGRSFLSVLRGETTEHREFVYAMHNNVPEGPPYPIRSVATREHRYIRNLTPEKLYIEKHLAGVVHHNPYYGSWWFQTWNDDHAMKIIRRWTLRPGEEFYARAADPFELDNLAEDSAHAGAMKRLSTELDRWMKSQKDRGVALDNLEALQTAREAAGAGRKPTKKKGAERSYHPMSAPGSETIAFLEDHIIFHGVPPQDLAIIFPFLEFEVFAAGTTIVEEGAVGKALYVITKGSVDIVKSIPTGRKGDPATMRLAILRRGDSFGEMEMLDTMKRAASAVAREDTICLVLTTGTFLKIHNCRPEAYPIILLNLARELSRRLRVAIDHIVELEARVAGLTRED